MLYIVATPIGNLQDITYRAVTTLQSCDLILAEDTRISRRLCTTYAIHTPMESHHKFNEKRGLRRILDKLVEGRSIALISDAGTPGICDPGGALIAACHKEGLPVCIIPGPSAVTSAVALSGFGDHPFQFLGFVPQKHTDETLARCLFYKGLTVFYEAPHRLVKTLKRLPADASVCIAREMTKIHEECRQGAASELAEHFSAHPPKGEIVLILLGYRTINADPKSCLSELQETFALDTKTALKIAVDLLDIPKKTLYDALHKNKA